MEIKDLGCHLHVPASVIRCRSGKGGQKATHSDSVAGSKVLHCHIIAAQCRKMTHYAALFHYLEIDRSLGRSVGRGHSSKHGTGNVELASSGDVMQLVRCFNSSISR